MSREKLLGALMNHFEELYSRSGSGRQVHDAWKARLDTLGRTITVRFRDEAFEGVAEDVDPEGNLQVAPARWERDDVRSRRSLASGVVRVRGVSRPAPPRLTRLKARPYELSWVVASGRFARCIVA